MNNITKHVRRFLLIAVAASLGACHFHGGGWGHHCRPVHHYHCR